MTIAMSPGVVQGAVELLGVASRATLPLAELAAAFPTFAGIGTNELIVFVQAIGWLRASDGNVATVTPAGDRLVHESSYSHILRRAIMDHVDVCAPAWLQAAASGRNRVIGFVASPLAQTFVEAGLTGPVDDDIVAFWDALAGRARGLRDSRLLAIGRRGERLTIAYERERTGREPIWVAVNSNLDGYDVLSFVASDDSRHLTIEVKTTAQGDSGRIYLTRHEWDRANASVCHVFDVWDVENEVPKLARLGLSQVATHVPSDSGVGRWESVSIAVHIFADEFLALPGL